LPLILYDVRRLKPPRVHADKVIMAFGTSAIDQRQSAVERLLRRARPHRSRRLSRRELAVEGAAATAFIAAAAALALLATGERPFSPSSAVVLVACYAVAARVRLYLGAGFGMPSQLVLVPMLFLLPASIVPAAVACALAAGAVTDVGLGRERAERVLTAVNDAWYAFGGALVLLAAGEPPAGAAALPVVLAALAGQGALDLCMTSLRERLGRGIPAGLQARVIALVYLIDLLLTPVALLTAAASLHHPPAVLALVPLLGLLGLFARDRRARIEETVQRLDALDEERARLDRTLSRVGDAFAANIDRAALCALAVRTVTDAVRAERGALVGPDEATPAAMAATAARARAAGAATTYREGEEHLLGHPLPGALPDGVLVVGRRGRPFNAEEQARVGQLVRQVAVALENVELHERLRAQAATDELTGLDNHRRFQEHLVGEVGRTRRTGEPLALVLLDIDDFKKVNDTHGHQRGDAVLRAVAGVLRTHCRPSDHAARYGGEELAIVLPGTDLRGARATAEAVRQGLHGLAIPTGGGDVVRITASLGVAELGLGCRDGAALVAMADAALYEAKRTGKDRTVAARPAATQSSGARFALQSPSSRA